MRMSLRILLIVAGFLALALAGLLVWLFGISKPAQSAPASPGASDTSQPSASASPVPTDVGAAISKLPTDADLVSDSSPFKDQFAQAFPTGTTTKPVDGTWAPDGDNQGVVQVDINRPGSADAKYAAMMVKENGQWKLLATVVVEP